MDDTGDAVVREVPGSQPMEALEDEKLLYGNVLLYDRSCVLFYYHVHVVVWKCVVVS